MLTKSELVTEISESLGLPRSSVRQMFEVLADIAWEEIKDGEDFVVPGIAKVSWTYVKPRKKGDTYIGFGGEETTAEKDRPAKVGLRAAPVSPISKIKPKSSDRAAQRRFLSTKAGKNIVARRG